MRQLVYLLLTVSNVKSKNRVNYVEQFTPSPLLSQKASGLNEHGRTAARRA